MATSFQTRVERENISNLVTKNVSKGAQVQRGLSTKTPRKALSDLGNIQNGTAKKFQTPKPSKIKIFHETPKAKTTIKSKKVSSSVLNSRKIHGKIATDVKVKPITESILPDIEKVIPFVDQENDLPRPKYVTKLLTQCRILNPSQLVSPSSYQEDLIATSSHYEFEPFEPPLFDETVANIIGYDENPELLQVDPHFLADLPPLDDIHLFSY